MTKRQRELQAKILELHNSAKSYMDGEQKDLAKAEELLNAADEAQKELDLEQRLEASKKTQLPETVEPVATEKADGFKAMTKLMSKQMLTEGEKALITGTDATSGENYLIPEDVDTAINELRKTYVSAKELVTVEMTESLSGSVNYEEGSVPGLTAFDDGDDIDATSQPSFVKKTFTIAFKGKLIPVSRILKGAEKADLMGYLNRWFVKNATISENTDIFATLKAGKGGSPKALAGWAALKKSINVDIDPSCRINGIIATNQSGFACLDEEVDANGRPILQPNPANPTEKLFQGMPIKVYPDAQLPNINSSRFPIFYGDTKAGATMKMHKGLQFSSSEHFLFGKNQDCLRVVEGYAVMSTDTAAYMFGSFSATPAPTTETTSG